MEQAVERLIALMDVLDAIEEDLEDDADSESSLGSPELTWEDFCSQEHWARGGCFGADAEDDGSDDREFDEGDSGIADWDGLCEQISCMRGAWGERVE
jgi:hypothetical protein